jgi:hypothetical protein
LTAFLTIDAPIVNLGVATNACRRESLGRSTNNGHIHGRFAQPDISAKYHCEESGTRFEFAWHRVDTLGGIRLVPGFLIDVLSNLPGAPQHVVQVDDSMRREPVGFPTNV